jgi:hypothetical protein
VPHTDEERALSSRSTAASFEPSPIDQRTGGRLALSGSEGHIAALRVSPPIQPV